LSCFLSTCEAGYHLNLFLSDGNSDEVVDY
jgi:hypothetical protein